MPPSRRLAAGRGTLAVLALLLASGTQSGAAVAEPAAAGELVPDLQRILEAFLAENPVAPGACVHVECPPLGLRWTGAAGLAARGSPEPLRPASTFRIASNTKTYVAAAVLRLVESGRLGLEDPLALHLPQPRRELLAADGYDLQAMTIEQVLSHTAGLCEHSGDPRYAEAIIADPRHPWTPQEQIRLAVEWCDPVGAPGERYHYSDTGYVILGGIVEQLTGLPLGPAVRELLGFERLGLGATWWEYQEEPPRGAAPRARQYYGEHDVTDWDASFDLFGGGGLIASAPDLARFLRRLLAGDVLQEATLAAMIGGGTPDYRLGLMCVELDGRPALGHQGFWNTFAFEVPSLDLTVAGAVTNHHAANGRELAQRLVARVAAAREAEAGR